MCSCAMLSTICEEQCVVMYVYYIPAYAVEGKFVYVYNTPAYRVKSRLYMYTIPLHIGLQLMICNMHVEPYACFAVTAV